MDYSKIVKERDENILISKPVHKTVLLCTNGFQTMDTHDSTPMKEYFDNQFRNEFSNCEVVCVKLFEPSDKKTHKASHFEAVLEDAIKDYISQGYDIQLMGYSFSSALVSKMAHKYHQHVTRVILVAPVYDTIVNHMIPGYIKYALKFMKLQKRYGKRVASSMSRQTVQGLPGLLIAIFTSILKNRKYFKKMDQDVLLIRGTEDVLCTNHAIKKVGKKLKGNHVQYTYPKFTHGILKTLKLNGCVYEDILHFAFGTPYLIENDAVEVKKENKEEVSYDIDGEKIPTFDEVFASLDPDGENLSLMEENEF